MNNYDSELQAAADITSATSPGMGNYLVLLLPLVSLILLVVFIILRKNTSYLVQKIAWILTLIVTSGLFLYLGFASFSIFDATCSHGCDTIDPAVILFAGIAFFNLIIVVIVLLFRPKK